MTAITGGAVGPDAKTAVEHWWLVGTAGNLPSGNPAKIVMSATKPTGYGYVAELSGSTLPEIEKSVLGALVSLPTGIAIPSSLTIPGFGSAGSNIKVSGPSGVAGAVDSGVTATGNGITSVLGLFTDVGLWKGIGLVLAGGILVILAIRQLSQR